MTDLLTKTKELRRLVVSMTTKAGSGHPTSCLSAVELMAVLMFGGIFKADFGDPQNPDNDRLLFSKGHAAPLLYALYCLLGQVREEELFTLRQFGSRLEGHPTKQFPYAEAATGSLGQGLSIGAGISLAAKLDKRPYRTYVLLGDGEMMEGSNWEAMAFASDRNLDNLTAIVDVSRLEQTGETDDGWHLEVFQNKFRAFGWLPIVVKNGHNLDEVTNAFQLGAKLQGKPVAIIAKTVKGKGVSFLENKPGWHGKVLDQKEADKALLEIAAKSNRASSQSTGTDEVLKRLAKLTIS